MAYENEHTQKKDIVKFTLKDGSIFGYIPMDAGEENDYMRDYMVNEEFINNEGKKIVKRVEDITKINMVKCYNLVETPYEDWDKKSNEQRWQFLRKLKPSIFSEIIINIKTIDNGEFQSKKNFSNLSEKESQTK